MKASRITIALIGIGLAMAGLMTAGVLFPAVSGETLLGYCAVATVVALVASEYRVGVRRLVPVR